MNDAARQRVVIARKKTVEAAVPEEIRKALWAAELPHKFTSKITREDRAAER